MMITINLQDGIVSEADKKLTQWDYGQQLQLSGVELPDNYEVVFSTYKCKQALKVNATSDIINIPDAILAILCAENINVYIQITNDDESTTVYEGLIKCNLRKIPSNYPIEIWESVSAYTTMINDYANACRNYIVTPIVDNVRLENTLARKNKIKLLSINTLDCTNHSQEINGITWTVMNDGTITANGTAIEDSTFIIKGTTTSDSSTDWILDKQSNLFVCEGGSSSTYFGVIWGEDISSTFISSKSNISEGQLIYGVGLRIASGYTANNVIFKPMLTSDLTATYQNYTPYNEFEILISNSDNTKSNKVRLSTEITESEFYGYDEVTLITSDYNPRVELDYAIDTMHYINPSIIVDSELSETSENPVQNKVITERLNEVFQYVSNGKTLVASAITDKGITTEATDTFEIMANNISMIQSGNNDSALVGTIAKETEVINDNVTVE